MAIKASCDVITSQIDTPSITQLTPVLPDLLQILADAIRAIHGKQSVSQIFDEGKH